MSARGAILLALVLNGCNTPRLEHNAQSIPKNIDRPQIARTDWTPEPVDKQEAKLRRSRGIAYSSDSQRHLGAGLGGHMFVDLVKLDRDFAPSPTVVLAEVTRTQSYLSRDLGNLYTEWTARVQEIIAQAASKSLGKDTQISINRVGGHLRMPSGEIYELTTSGLPNPLFTNKTYILFLTYDPCCDWFQLDKSWIVENGKMQPVDNWDGNSRYAGIPLDEFRREYQNYHAALRR